MLSTRKTSYPVLSRMTCFLLLRGSTLFECNILREAHRTVVVIDGSKCSCCSLEAITKPEECICCKEIDRVGEVMGQLDLEDRCITLHPGFQDVCLNRWVLEVASLNLKTKSGKSYRVLRGQGGRTEAE